MAAASSTARSPRSARCRGSSRRSAAGAGLIDGGFRRGVDVIKALALGARAVLIGRPHLWGVACAGEDGVLWVLELFRREIDRALALGGWDGVAKLDASIFFAQGPTASDARLAPRRSSGWRVRADDCASAPF